MLDEEKRRKKAANNKTHTRGIRSNGGNRLSHSLPVALAFVESRCITTIKSKSGNICKDM